MCIVSNVGDYYSRKWTDIIPSVPYNHIPPTPVIGWDNFKFKTNVSKEEFEKLRAEVLEMRELLKMAKIIDEKTGQPDCEMEDKVAILKKMADIFGVDLSEIFDK